ncbi:MAG: SurA N-terminal domain-containing protein [Clostridia bacterium]|nr:SurA N-terminal domain-containing protein [Clostridia bacterium]
MKMIKRLLALIAALALLSAAALAETAPDDVMATINGVAITRQTYESYLQNLSEYYAYYGYDVTSAENTAYLRYLSLSTLVQLTLMDQKIAEMGVTLTADELAAAQEEGRSLWVQDVSNALSYRGVTSESSEAERAAVMVQLLADLEALGYTEESYIAESVSSALYLKLEALMVEGATVPEGEVQYLYEQLVEEDRQRYAEDAAAYESTCQMNAFAQMTGMTEYYQDVWYIPEGYRIMTHILLPVDAATLEAWSELQAVYEEQQILLEEGGAITGEAVTAEEVENARLAMLTSTQAQADEIASRLAAGESFASLIPLYTADESMNEEAEIAAGYPIHMDSIFCPAGYRDAAFALAQHGDVSAPFVSDDGVYILCYVSDAQGGPVALTTELHAALHAQLLEEAQAALYQQTMAAWEAEADIVYSDEALSFLPAY